MSLLTHVKKGDWDRLEDEWTALMLGDASPGPVLEAIPHAAKRRELPRLIPLLRDHAELLSGAKRGAEAASLLGTAMLEGGSPGELAKPLYQAAEAAWGSEPWWPAFCDIAGFAENAADMRAAWRTLRNLLALKDGKAVYHATGWGIGAIERMDLDALEVDVRFASGRRDRFPLTTAVEIFEVLEPDDPRALVVTDPAALKRLVKDEPLSLLRSVTSRLGGQVSYHQLKITMAALGVDGPAFSSFWRRARKGADESSWFEVTGAGTKVQVRLLATEADPAESLRRQLERSADLATALQRVRDVLSARDLDDALRATALDTLAALAAREERDRPRRFAAWMLLREVHGVTPPGLAEALAEAASAPQPSAGEPPALWTLFHSLPNLRDQEKAIELLQEVRGDAWIDEAARELSHAAPGMARALVDALAEAGRASDLVAHYAGLLLRPARNPSVLVALAAYLERDRELAARVSPAAVQRATALLQLATHLKRQPASDALAARARARLTALLSEGAPPLLRRLLAEVETDDLRRLNAMVERGVDAEIDRVFTAVVVEVAPEIFRGADRPFWENGSIWTTRAAFARREEELRILRDIKIPENSEAIGRAAAYGDLSENSEWEAAIEEQRTLTTRAQEIEAELRSAAFLEDAALPEDVVSPGTRVRYREDGRTEREVTILGPWDGGADDSVTSYRSPLAAGLLGARTGDRVVVQLPSGTIRVEVLEIRPADLGTAPTRGHPQGQPSS